MKEAAMTDWNVTLGYDGDQHLTPDDIDTLHDTLTQVHPAIAVAAPDTDPAADITVTVTAGTAIAALTKARKIVDASLPGWQLTRIEVLTTTAFDVAADRPLIPELVGLAEAAEIIGVTRQRAHVLAAGSTFPPAVAQLASTPVWRRDAVEAWAKIPRRTGRPRAS